MRGGYPPEPWRRRVRFGGFRPTKRVERCHGRKAVGLHGQPAPVNVIVYLLRAEYFTSTFFSLPAESRSLPGSARNSPRATARGLLAQPAGLHGPQSAVELSKQASWEPHRGWSGHGVPYRMIR